MIIPVKCFTCGKVIGDKYLAYQNDVLKRKIEEKINPEKIEYLDDSSTSSVYIKEEKNDNIKSMDLKSINITLEETKPEQPLDYKKMAIPKLRSIVAEKGLSSDSSKLKKNELLKLLGVE